MVCFLLSVCWQQWLIQRQRCQQQSSHEFSFGLSCLLWAPAWFIWISVPPAPQSWITPERRRARGRSGAVKWPRGAAGTRGPPAPPRPLGSLWLDQTSELARRSAVATLESWNSVREAIRVLFVHKSLHGAARGEVLCLKAPSRSESPELWCS